MDQIQLILREEYDKDLVHAVERGLHAFNVSTSGIDDGRFVGVFARDGAGEVVGGIYGWSYWSALEIKDFWLREGARRQGLGTQLIEAIEARARERGCTMAYLDTFNFQAPKFYAKRGYEVFGTLDGFAGGITRYYLKKALG